MCVSKKKELWHWREEKIQVDKWKASGKETVQFLEINDVGELELACLEHARMCEGVK